MLLLNSNMQKKFVWESEDDGGNKTYLSFINFFCFLYS